MVRERGLSPDRSDRFGQRFDKSAIGAYGAAMVPSPCVNICQVDRDRGLCRGCGRTLPEIAGWPRFDEAEKRRVIIAAAQRLEQARCRTA